MTPVRMARISADPLNLTAHLDAVEDVATVLTVDPVAQRTEVVAEVHLAGRLDAREHARHETTLVEGFPTSPS